MKQKVKSIVYTTLCLSALIFLSGCNPEASGFALPPGDAQRGEAAFVKLGCNQCHSVAGGVEQLVDGHETISFELGGYVTNVRTYGDLVTSIINPSHRISGGRNVGPHIDEEGGSRMAVMNEVMTVAELIDITAFLRDTYQVVPPTYTPRGI